VTYGIVQTRRFARAYKRLHANVAAEVDDAVVSIAADPQVGDRKKGDLATLRVYKFRAVGQLYLLGYTVDEGVRLIYLGAVGPHENFYRDLKR
jgi:mRNA-degrading endonuclease RelE of RelBE toxin-antitoxin system